MVGRRRGKGSEINISLYTYHLRYVRFKCARMCFVAHSYFLVVQRAYSATFRSVYYMRESLLIDQNFKILAH